MYSLIFTVWVPTSLCLGLLDLFQSKGAFQKSELAGQTGLLESETLT